MSTTHALKTINVSKIYATDKVEVRAVDDISIEIGKGEFIALVGPSGSGKTTMLAMLAGLLRPSEGEVFIDDHDLSQLSDSDLTRFRLKNIGFTFQANNLVPYLSALENVELMLRLNSRFNRAAAAKAKELLVRLGLEDRLNNLPSQLSGGQRQRVAIARALVHDPAVVLADEPTASLDTERAFQVVETFASLIHEENRAGIMVTHDLRMCAFVDKVIQMIDGKLARIITDPAEIKAFAGTGHGEIKKQAVPAEKQAQQAHQNGFRPAPNPA
ncbi:MAG: ABC transporter ATP-binding protein [Chloroflexota bacterium]